VGLPQDSSQPATSLTLVSEQEGADWVAAQPLSPLPMSTPSLWLHSVEASPQAQPGMDLGGGSMGVVPSAIWIVTKFLPPLRRALWEFLSSGLVGFGC
jgi:hypothetical protein